MKMGYQSTQRLWFYASGMWKSEVGKAGAAYRNEAQSWWLRDGAANRKALALSLASARPCKPPSLSHKPTGADNTLLTRYLTGVL